MHWETYLSIWFLSESYLNHSDVAFVVSLLSDNTGFSQGESELVAKDDNLDAADPNKDKKNQDKDEQINDEEKEKVNEQGDEVIFF